MKRAGFTLIEIMLAMAILVIVVSMVYTTFSSVTTTMGVTRVLSEEMRLRQFLERNFQNNFSSVYLDQGFGLPAYQFIGINGDENGLPFDTVRFASSAPMMGGLALPGDLKEVRYEVLGVEGRIGEFSLRDDEPAGEGPQLRATETPLSIAALMIASGVADDPERESELDTGFEAPTWTVPIRTFDIRYYDGAEWVDEWDSEIVGRLPWSVHIRVNFARTEAQIEDEEDENIDIEEDPDFEMVIPLPTGFGRLQDGRELAAMESELAMQERRRELEGVDAGRGATGEHDTATGEPAQSSSVFGFGGEDGGDPKQP